MKDNITVAWWSAGITSAVACKIALQMYENVELYYIHIDTAHEDNVRFKKECEEWYGVKINPLKSHKYKDQFDVIKQVKAVNTPQGAPCTGKLKKDVRFELEKKFALTLFNNKTISNQVWGYEFEKKEINRAIRHGQQYRETNPLFPLIERKLTKNNCAAILKRQGIEQPTMYKLGYTNNNCIGCVKGGMGYWNKIRVDFPKIFNKMSIIEREIGYSCINGVFLDELKPGRGRMKKEVIPDCGIICELELMNIESENVEKVKNGKISIYEAIK